MKLQESIQKHAVECELGLMLKMRTTIKIRELYMNVKLIMVWLILIGMLSLAYTAYVWKNTDMNLNPKKGMLECISTENKSYEGVINSINTNFRVTVVRSSADCINPFFPAIRIEPLHFHSGAAWIHIVHTDSDIDIMKNFIDGLSDTFPFYNHEKEFLDAPLWTYGIFSKPISYWEGYAYYVQPLDEGFRCLGGIKWGFRLKYYMLHPEIIMPVAVSKEECERDMQMLPNMKGLN